MIGGHYMLEHNLPWHSLVDTFYSNIFSMHMLPTTLLFTLSGAFVGLVYLKMKRAWDSLLLERNFSQNLIDSSVDGILAFDREYRYTVWNSAMERISGIKKDMVLGKCAFDVFPFLQETGEDKFFHQALSGKSVVSQDRPYIVPQTGHKGFFEGYYSPLRDKAGAISGGLGVIHEVTERKQAIQKIKESEQKLTAIFENAIDGVLVADVKTRQFRMANPSICRMLGYDMEEMINLGIADIHPEKALPFVIEQFEKMARKEITFTKNIPVKKSNGNVFYADINASLMAIGGEECLLGLFRDVTEKKRAEEEVFKSEKKYRNIFENSPVSLWEADISKIEAYIDNLRNSGVSNFRKYFEDHPEAVEECVLLYKTININQAALNLYKAKNKQEITESLNKIFTKETLKGYKEFLISIVECKTEFYIENENMTMTGEKIYVAVHMFMISGYGGKRSMILASLTNITKRKQAEKLVFQTQKDWEKIFNSITDMVTIHDIDFNIIFANDAANKNLKLPSQGDALVKCFKYYHGTKAPPQGCPSCNTLKTGIPASFELFEPYLNMDIEIRALPRFDDEHQVVGIIHIVRDIGKRKKAEKQLHNLTAHLITVREEERAHVAREIHDELGQTLTALNMDIHWMKKKLAPNQAQLHEKTLSMSKLIREALRLIQKIYSELRPILLDNVGLYEALEWQAMEFQDRTGVTCEVAFDSSPINLDRDCSIMIFRIYQEALTNVCRHANATKVKLIMNGCDDTLEILLSDNGKGITEEQITAPESFGIRGMRERVEHLKGDFSIKGIPDEGTKIKIKIPFKRSKSENDGIVLENHKGVQGKKSCT
jgi:PAS domain S-box-containing protein